MADETASKPGAASGVTPEPEAPSPRAESLVDVQRLVHLANISNSTIILGNWNRTDSPARTTEAENIAASARVAAVLPREARVLSVPSHEFDREHHRKAIQTHLARDEPILIPLIGPSGQGHDSLIEYCRFHASQDVPRMLQIRRWPVSAHPDVMVERICEQFGSQLFGDQARPTSKPEALLEELREKRARADQHRVIVVHEIRRPMPTDARVLAKYLECVWRPIIAERLLGDHPVAIFAVHTARRSWMDSLGAFLGVGAGAGVRATQRCLSRFAASLGARIAATSQLAAIRREELLVHYARVSQGSTDDVNDAVDDLMATTGGDFDAVLARVYPLEGI